MWGWGAATEVAGGFCSVILIPTYFELVTWSATRKFYNIYLFFEDNAAVAHRHAVRIIGESSTGKETIGEAEENPCSP